MTIRIAALLSALLGVGAALAAAPATAAGGGTPGGAPAIEPGSTRAAPMTLPGAVAAMPTPQVDTETASRDIIPIDPADFTTVVYRIGGTVEEIPPSEGLRSVVEAWIAGHE
jgi:hypothetical protein